MVEQPIRNRQVVGSTPTLGSTQPLSQAVTQSQLSSLFPPVVKLLPVFFSSLALSTSIA